MSDETPTPVVPDADDQPADVVAHEPAMPPAAPAEPVEPAPRVTFTNKFLLPLLVPIGVAATIIFYVLNVSRIFLASQDALAVTYATIITVLILAGGSALAAAPKLRSSSLTLMLGGGFLVLLMGGLISIGAASPKGESGPVQCKPVTSKITVNALNTLRYAFPNGNTVKGGCVDLTLALDGNHTLQFDAAPASTTFPELDASQKTWAGTLAPGDYKFHCTIPGHEAAGMVADLVVTK